MNRAIKCEQQEVCVKQKTKNGLDNQASLAFLSKTLTRKRALDSDADRRRVALIVRIAHFIRKTVPSYEVSVRPVVDRTIRVDFHHSVLGLCEIRNGVGKSSVGILVVVENGNVFVFVRTAVILRRPFLSLGRRASGRRKNSFCDGRRTKGWCVRGIQGGQSPRGFEKWDGRKAFRTNLPSRASGLILDGAD